MSFFLSLSISLGRFAGDNLCNFLLHRSEFKTDADVHLAFEDFLCAAKGSLTPSEIAKIRDTVGVIGMAGT